MGGAESEHVQSWRPFEAESTVDTDTEVYAEHMQAAGAQFPSRQDTSANNSRDGDHSREAMEVQAGCIAYRP